MIDVWFKHISIYLSFFLSVFLSFFLLNGHFWANISGIIILCFYTFFVDDECKNQRNDCREFGTQMCQEPYKIWAKENCAKYCGFCGPGKVYFRRIIFFSLGFFHPTWEIFTHFVMSPLPVQGCGDINCFRRHILLPATIYAGTLVTY